MCLLFPFPTSLTLCHWKPEITSVFGWLVDEWIVGQSLRLVVLCLIGALIGSQTTQKEKTKKKTFKVCCTAAAANCDPCSAKRLIYSKFIILIFWNPTDRLLLELFKSKLVWERQKKTAHETNNYWNCLKTLIVCLLKKRRAMSAVSPCSRFDVWHYLRVFARLIVIHPSLFFVFCLLLHSKTKILLTCPGLCVRPTTTLPLLGPGHFSCLRGSRVGYHEAPSAQPLHW